MDRTEAQTAAEGILGALATQTDADTWERALDASVTVDPAGRLPDHEDWEPTFEPYWAAAEVAEALSLHAMGAGGVAEFTSEGATFKMAQPQLAALAQRLRGKSPLSALTGSGIGWVDVERSPLGYGHRSGQDWT